MEYDTHNDPNGRRLCGIYTLRWNRCDDGAKTHAIGYSYNSRNR